VAQGDLRAVSNLQRLTFGDGSQTSLALQIFVKISPVKKPDNLRIPQDWLGKQKS
jgi:hypothetical protein